MEGLSVIIPVHSEEKIITRNTERLIGFLNRYCKNYEIILCDNGSTDSTAEKGELLAKKHKKVRFLRVERKGLGLALKELIKNSRFEKIIFLPIDFSINLKFVGEALQLLGKYDMVIGSKRMDGAVDDRPFGRRFSTFLFNSLVNLFFGLGIKDTQCVKGFRKSRIKKINDEIKSEDLFFDVELLIKAKKSRLKMIEIPVICKDHRKSKFKVLGESFKIFFRIIDFWIGSKLKKMVG